MLTLNVQVVVHLTARTRQERERWAGLFTRLLGSCNKAFTHGVWVGGNGVESEPDIVLRWLAEEHEVAKFERLVRYVRMYHRAAEQEAVLLEVNDQRFVIFQDDWGCPATAERLLEAFSPGLALANWFDRKAEESAAVERLEMGWGS